MRYNGALRRMPARQAQSIGRIIAYDLETTPIPEERSYNDLPPAPIPLYLTAWGYEGLILSEPLGSYEALADVLATKMLISKYRNARFVAWNANRFDLRIVINSICDNLDAYTIYPFVARNAGLRGAKISQVDSVRGNHWMLYDGIAMTGCKMKLEKFVATYAPHVPKLAGTINFDAGEKFDAKNPLHVAYAERDAEALYHAMQGVEAISLRHLKIPLRATIGKLGILYLQSRIPEGVEVWRLSDVAENLVREYGFRGGYVHTSRKYRGPAWGYDINQAYAASMRDTRLPCGTLRATTGYIRTVPGIYVVDLQREPLAAHPFLVKRYAPDCPGDTVQVQTYGEPMTTVLTSIEIETLRAHEWDVNVRAGYMWDDFFTLSEMVNELEELRLSDEQGPSGPIGTFSKYVGCNAYGKTVERIEPIRRAISRVEPPGKFWQLEFPQDESLHNFWLQIIENPVAQLREYHRPQIGAFITAGVRCVIYNAIMTEPETFLKADTDSVAFSKPNHTLPIHARLYGQFKLEYDGAEHIIIAKKVYAVRDGGETKIVCKGLQVKKLTWDDMIAWFETGRAPSQRQVQLQSWKHGVGSQAPMYRVQTRKGTGT